MMERKPEDIVGGGKRHSSTRRKFLQFLGTASGLLLTACGHGFVKPINETEDPLIIELTDQEKRILDFISALPKNHALQSSFIQNPVATLVQHNIIPKDSQLNISKANRLLFYLVSNQELQERIGAVVQSYPAFLGPDTERHDMNNDRLDVGLLRKVEKDLASSDSLWRKVLEDQISVLVSDQKVREILGLKIADSQVKEYASRLATAISRHLSKTEFRPAILYFYPNLFAVVNVNWKVNVNSHYNVNVNANARYNLNVNVSANWNVNVNWNIDGGNGVGTLEEWIKFVDLFTKHAHEQLGRMGEP